MSENRQVFLEVLDAGLAVSVQDGGRPGYRALGVPLAGAMDAGLMAAANALVGNELDAAVLEIGAGGPTLQAIGAPVRVALAGPLSASLMREDGSLQTIGGWRTVTLGVGDRLRVAGAARGTGCLAVSGGIGVAPQLGSRSTYRRARLGGVDGRLLQVGDRLPCSATRSDTPRERRAALAWRPHEGPIRVIPGPQQDHFRSEAIERFYADPWRVTRDFDRMGLRLEGTPLAHGARSADIVSDGVVPGAIQVPGNGQPIVLLADGQTTGGYPKIATVIRADLPRFAHLQPGDEVRFTAVGHGQARAALERADAQFERWRAGIEEFLPAGFVDEAMLLGGNLVSGVLRGDEPFAAAL